MTAEPKECVHCKAVRPRGDFYVANPRTGRLHSWCRFCVAERARRWNRENRDRANANWRAWYHRHHEQQLERNRRRYEEKKGQSPSPGEA